MISIIVSTYKPNLFNRLSENIKETIGVDYELIPIYNQSKYSLCQAYNIGLEQASYNYLCFIHEDVIFKTKDWGRHLASAMENDKKIGLIGVAGTKFKSTYPTASWGQSSFLKKFKRGHIFVFSDNKVEKHVEYDISKYPKEIEEVVCIDGIFMFTKKEVFQNCKYDELTFTNFHCYDLDFSLQVHFQSYKVVVDRSIDLIHLSKGNYNSHFTLANKLLQKKWKSKLPIASRDLGFNKYQLHYYNLINYIISLKDSLILKLKNLEFN